MLTNQLEKDILGYLIGYSESGKESLLLLVVKCLNPGKDNFRIAHDAVTHLKEQGFVEEHKEEGCGAVYSATQKGRDEQKTWPENQGFW